MEQMLITIWEQVQDPLADAIAKIAVELLETGVKVAMDHLKAVQESTPVPAA